MESDDIMDNKFGKSALTRRVLEELEELPNPICSAGLSDFQMQELAGTIEGAINRLSII